MSEDQYSSSVISHLHELKASYQRNMIVAMLVVSIFGVVSIGTICLIPDAVTEDGFVAVSPGDVLHPPPTGETGKSAADARPSKYTHHEGFGGFKGYAIARSPFNHGGYDLNDADISPFARLSSIDLSEHQISDHVYSFASGIDEDYGLPPTSTFFDILPSSRWTVSLGTRRSIHPPLTGTDAPPLIRLADARHPRKGWHINGTVVVVFVITEDGSIAEYQVVQEEPPGHDFALELKEAINESVFFPAEINGVKVPFRLTLTYEFCWGCSKPTGVQLSEGVIVSHKPF